VLGLNVLEFIEPSVLINVPIYDDRQQEKNKRDPDRASEFEVPVPWPIVIAYINAVLRFPSVLSFLSFGIAVLTALFVAVAAL
jgi:hypothetical protein